MLNITETVNEEIHTILGDLIDEGEQLQPTERLRDMGMNSLMYARLIIALERRCGLDPFTSGTAQVSDMRTIGDFISAYEKEALLQDGVES